MLVKDMRVMWLALGLCWLGDGWVWGAEPEFAVHTIRKGPAWITSVHQVVLSDIDKDGDLVIKGWTDGSFLYLENKPHATAQAQLCRDVAQPPPAGGIEESPPRAAVPHGGVAQPPPAWITSVHQVVLSDIDKDGDLVIKGWTDGSFLYLENKPHATAQAQLWRCSPAAPGWGKTGQGW